MLRRALLPLFLALTLLGCDRETPQPPPAPKQVQAAPRDGGRLVRRLEADVQTLNYVLHSTEDERQVLSLIYDPLIELDANLAPIPGLATRWEVLDGGKTYVFHLDPRATFSDGKPVRASDVVFTLHKILDEESIQFAPFFNALDRAQTQATDDRTVRVVFTEPRVGQLLSFNVGIMPEHVYGKGDFKKSTAVIGSGPYALKRREAGRSILVERRDDYWRAKPKIHSVLFRQVGDDTVAWKATALGQIDVARVDNDLWFRVKDDPAVQQKLAFHDVWQFAYNSFAWNLDDPLFNDVRVRRALAMCFDRRTVIDTLYRGQARPVTGPFTPDLWAHNPRVAPIEFNPQGGAALLSSAGWRDTDNDGILDRDGKKFSFKMLVVSGNKPSMDQTQVLQAALRGVGVELEITPLDGAAFYEAVFGRNFQAAFVAWVIDPDPDPSSLFHSRELAPTGMNIVGYKNPEADALMDQARTQFDPARRTELYHSLHEILARDQPYLWTVQSSLKWAVNRRVQGVQAVRGVGLFHWYPGTNAWWLRE